MTKRWFLQNDAKTLRFGKKECPSCRALHAGDLRRSFALSNLAERLAERSLSPDALARWRATLARSQSLARDREAIDLGGDLAGSDDDADDDELGDAGECSTCAASS